MPQALAAAQIDAEVVPENDQFDAPIADDISDVQEEEVRLPRTQRTGRTRPSRESTQRTRPSRERTQPSQQRTCSSSSCHFCNVAQCATTSGCETKSNRWCQPVCSSSSCHTCDLDTHGSGGATQCATTSGCEKHTFTRTFTHGGHTHSKTYSGCRKAPVV